MKGNSVLEMPVDVSRIKTQRNGYETMSIFYMKCLRNICTLLK